MDWMRLRGQVFIIPQLPWAAGECAWGGAVLCWAAYTTEASLAALPTITLVFFSLCLHKSASKCSCCQKSTAIVQLLVQQVVLHMPGCRRPGDSRLKNTSGSWTVYGSWIAMYQTAWTVFVRSWNSIGGNGRQPRPFGTCGYAVLFSLFLEARCTWQMRICLNGTVVLPVNSHVFYELLYISHLLLMEKFQSSRRRTLGLGFFGTETKTDRVLDYPTGACYCQNVPLGVQSAFGV